MLQGYFPTPPLPATPAVLLEAFLAEQAIIQQVDADPDILDEVATQRIYATLEGARSRALIVGGLKGHAEQAAALLVGIFELDQLLDGSITIGGAERLREKLDAEEYAPLQLVRDLMARLLDWHFREGAGALLPLADDLGLVWHPEERRAA